MEIQRDEKWAADVIKAVLALADLYERQLSEPALDLWLNALSGLTVEQVRSAAAKIVRERVYAKMPVPAEFLNAVNGNVDDRAQVEADKVLSAIRSVGAYNSVAFDDPVTIAVIRHGFGGWIKMCGDLEAKDTKWFAKDFVRIYSAYAREGVPDGGHLVGVVERDNSAAGYAEHIPTPVLIGDKSKARALIEAKKQPPTKSARLIDLASKIGA